MLWKGKTKENSENLVVDNRYIKANEKLRKLFTEHTYEKILRSNDLRGQVIEISEKEYALCHGFQDVADSLSKFFEMKSIKKPVFEIGDKITDGTIDVDKKFAANGPFLGYTHYYRFEDNCNDVEFEIERGYCSPFYAYTCEQSSFSEVEMKYLVDKAEYALHRKAMKPKEEFRDKLISIYCEEKTMVTANDLRKYIKDKEESIEDKVDKWLKDVVFPRFTVDGSGFEVPEWTTRGELEKLLGKRGFSTTSHCGYQGSFVYISLPPCQE